MGTRKAKSQTTAESNLCALPRPGLFLGYFIITDLWKVVAQGSGENWIIGTKLFWRWLNKIGLVLRTDAPTGKDGVSKTKSERDVK